MQNKDLEDNYGSTAPILTDLSNVKLPQPEMVTFWRNYKDRILVIDTDIDESILEYVKMIFQFNKEDKNIPVNERKEIIIWLYSYGGDPYVGNVLIDAIELSKTSITIINCGIAASMAGLIAMSGNHRYCLPKAQYLIHQGQAGVQGNTNQVFETVDNLKKVEKEVKEYVLSHTKIDNKLYIKKSKVEWYINAQEAVELGVCDKIITDIDDLY